MNHSSLRRAAIASRVTVWRRFFAFLAVILIVTASLSTGIAVFAVQTGNEQPLLFGGCGGLYCYAETGDLWIDIFKQDLNTGPQETHLRAVFFAPDRTVIEEKWINDDGLAAGKPGPVQRVHFQTHVDRPGVYGVNVTVTNDRYGEAMSWGFMTNCRKYLVETSRGHRDARHEEPLVFRSPDRATDVYFLPQQGTCAIDISGLPKGVAAVPVFDAGGHEAAVLTVGADGTTHHELATGDVAAGVPWRLHLAKSQAVVAIDGVTRWTGGAVWENLSLWTPEKSSWFPFHNYRWLMTPYHRVVYAEPGEKRNLEYTITNNSAIHQRVLLALEFDTDAAWQVTLNRSELSVAPGQTETVTVLYEFPPNSDEKTCYLRATSMNDDCFSTFSSLTVKRGTAPAESPLTIPVKLEPYCHENEQFGYIPDYPLDNQVYFDPENRPFIVATNGIWRKVSGIWEKKLLARRADTGGDIRIAPVITKVAFDSHGGVYTIGRADGTTFMLYSRDHGDTYTAWTIPGEGSFDIEQFSGHNIPDGTPPFVRFRKTAQDPNLMWRGINDLELFVPVLKADGSIDIGSPVLISKQCIGLSAHSGIPSTIVSRGDKVHIAWGEATPPEENIPGVPTYIVTYDRKTDVLGTPALAGYGPPANDVHNSPCITMDSKGFLHVLIGTHGRTFKYVRSLKPNDAGGGWTEAEDVGPGLAQTYVGMVCGPDDALHLVFRLWLNDTKYFPAGYYANLASMSKRPGEPWSEARPLIVAPFSEYSIFYHRLTIDRRGKLYLSYDYWSTFWFYRNDHKGNRRSLIISSDSGKTWRLTTGQW